MHVEAEHGFVQGHNELPAPMFKEWERTLGLANLRAKSM